MKLLLLPLLLLLFAAMLGVCRTVGIVDFSGNPMGGGYVNGSEREYGESATNQSVWDIAGNMSMSGSNSYEASAGYSASVAMSTVISVGVIGLIITSVAFAGIIGIRVLGSGLAEFSVMAIFRLAACYGIWCLFSAFGLVLFAEVPLFGYPLYFMLTFFYTMGVLDTMKMGSA